MLYQYAYIRVGLKQSVYEEFTMRYTNGRLVFERLLTDSKQSSGYSVPIEQCCVVPIVLFCIVSLLIVLYYECCEGCSSAKQETAFND